MPPRSLRARLLLLFVGSVAAVAVLVVAVAVRQTSHDQRIASERNLRTQAVAVTELLAKRQENDLGTFGQGEFFLPTLQRVTTATQFLYAPYQQLPPPTKIDLEPLPAPYAGMLDWNRLAKQGSTQTLEIHLPGSSQTYLAVAAPFKLKKGPISATIGAVVLVRPSDELSTSALSLTRRLLPAVVIVIVVIALLHLPLAASDAPGEGAVRGQRAHRPRPVRRAAAQQGTRRARAACSRTSSGWRTSCASRTSTSATS